MSGFLWAYDGDESGVSDVYEAMYGRVLPASEDADQDGYSNYEEYLFGSNPLDAESSGELQFEVEEGRARVRIPNQAGLRFRLESSVSLGGDSWIPMSDYVVSTGSSGVYEFDVSHDALRFFRIRVAPPLNSDGDGLDDWEEEQLGTDPTLSDTDNDLLDDDVETMVTGSDPHRVDTDQDGFVDKDEYESGSDPKDAQAWPPEVTDQPWSQPVTIQNTSAPVNLYPDVWSAPVTIYNQSAPVSVYNDVWSAPIVVKNEAFVGTGSYEVWSSPILVKNTFTEPAP